MVRPLLQNFWLSWPLTALLVVLTYNPRGPSYYHWVSAAAAVSHWHVLPGVGLALAYLLLVRQAWLGLRTWGMLLASLVLGAVAWLAADVSRLDLADRRMVSWVGLLILATVLAAGASWSYDHRGSGRR